MFDSASGKLTGVSTHFLYSTVLPNWMKIKKNNDEHPCQSQSTLHSHQKSTHGRDDKEIQEQATLPATLSCYFSCALTIYQKDFSMQLDHTTLDIVCMGGGIIVETPAVAFHLRRCKSYRRRNDTTTILAEG
jgi:hypothetical protein